MSESNASMTLKFPEERLLKQGKPLQQFLPPLQQNRRSLSDAAMTRQIRQVLEADPLLRKSDITHLRAKVEGGIVTLSGHVTRLMNKERAEEVADTVAGLSGVVNHLVVDDELMIAVAQRLAHDPRMTNDQGAEQGGEQVIVNVQHGVVYVSGTIRCAAVRPIAAIVAAALPEVRGVVNRIQSPNVVMDKEEERFLQPFITSEVYAINGKVGSVERVLINPDNRRVSALVTRVDLSPFQTSNKQAINKNAPVQRTILIPISLVRYISNSGVFLNVRGGEFVDFASSDHASQIKPPADWQPPFPYALTDVGFTMASGEK